MITLLWEDKGGVDAKRFGPHALVVGCLADELRWERREIDRQVRSIPRKGNGNVIKALKNDLPDLQQAGSVIAVLDADQVAGLLEQPVIPVGCIAQSARLLYAQLPGEYRVLLLEKSVDTLVERASELTRQAFAGRKATPDERDRILGKAAWHPARQVRDDIRAAVPTFDRLVARLHQALAVPLSHR